MVGALKNCIISDTHDKQYSRFLSTDVALMDRVQLRNSRDFLKARAPLISGATSPCQGKWETFTSVQGKR